MFGSAADERGAILRLSNEALAVGCSPAQVVQYRRDAALGEAGHEICYAARANAFVIRPDGRVAKCTVALDDERNTVGRLRKNGDVVIDPSRHLPWLQGLVSGDAVALNCPARRSGSPKSCCDKPGDRPKACSGPFEYATMRANG